MKAYDYLRDAKTDMQFNTRYGEIADEYVRVIRAVLGEQGLKNVRHEARVLAREIIGNMLIRDYSEKSD